MSNKKEHLIYIKQKGEFNIRCSNAIFSNLEITLLRNMVTGFLHSLMEI